MDYIAIGKRIKEKRLFLGYTQEQLAELSKINTSYMSNIETGKRKMSLDTIVKISKALESSLDYILFGEFKTESVKKDSQLEEIQNILENVDSEFLEEYIAYIKNLAITMTEIKNQNKIKKCKNEEETD